MLTSFLETELWVNGDDDARPILENLFDMKFDWMSA